MKYRWKLLLLFLCISVIPIVGLRTFGIHNVRLMAAALSENIEKSSLEDARNRLRVLNSQIAAGIGKSMREVEMALFLQAFEVDRTLWGKRGRGTPADASQAAETGTARPRGAASGRFRPGGDGTARGPVTPRPALPSRPSPETLRNAVEPVFEAISQRLGGLVLKQYVRVESGASIAYASGTAVTSPGPSHDDHWYRAAKRDRFSPWTPPFTDGASGAVVMTAYQPLEDDGERFLGATAIMVPVEALLEPLAVLKEIPPETLLMACTIDRSPADGRTGARIVFQSRQRPLSGEGRPREDRWLEPSRDPQFEALLRDFAARKTQVREMPYRGRPSFWVYGPLPDHGTAYLLIAPREAFLQPTRTVLETIRGRVTRVENLTVSFLLFLVVTVTVLALKFSRTVTRPLDTLTRAARSLAEGDLRMQVQMPSRDEFHELAEVFNRVGPQLMEHYQARRAMEVAMEIQQHLLPQQPPAVDGMEVYGMTVYSDETGGDYFDYLCTGKTEEGRLCIAVGDVAGHGIPSALLMATARGLIRLRSTFSGSIAEIVGDVNVQFAEDVGDSGEFMTLLLARVDSRRKRVSWVRAGHDPAILYDPHRDAFVELGGGRGLPLGVNRNAPYTQSVQGLRSGQVLCFGTDGIWEARNPAGEQFGIDRLKRAIRSYAAASAQMIVLSVIDEVQDFRETFQQEDDLTFVVVKVV